jgi:ubiquinone/menaquinone biosynthesis C-methylase UbiE
MQANDYRNSHQTRGNVYDESLALDPIDAYMHAWERTHVRALLPLHLPRPASSCRYLDFACGTGRVTEIVAPMVSETVGVDVSESMLAVARSKISTARFVHIDVTKEPFETGSFDVVSAFRFFGNANPALREDALAAMHRSLRAGGLLITNNHRNPWALINLVQRVQGEAPAIDLTYRRFDQLLRNAGFELVAVRAIGAWLFRHALVARAGSRPGLESRLEALFGGSACARFAPDYIVVARKAA